MSGRDREVITTERLVLLPLRVEHADEMATVLGDPELHAFIGGAPATRHDLRARYDRLVEGSPEPAVRWHNWVIRLLAEECLVGTVQATVRLRQPLFAADIAWVVGVPWQGRRIASEAARGLLGWLAGRRVGTVNAYIHPDHHASAAVAVAAGLDQTEHVHDGERRWTRTLARRGA